MIYTQEWRIIENGFYYKTDFSVPQKSIILVSNWYKTYKTEKPLDHLLKNIKENY